MNPRHESLLTDIFHALLILEQRYTQLLNLVHAPSVEQAVVADGSRVLRAKSHRHRPEHAVSQVCRRLRVRWETLDWEVLRCLLSPLSRRCLVVRIIFFVIVFF